MVTFAVVQVGAVQVPVRVLAHLQPVLGLVQLFQQPLAFGFVHRFHRPMGNPPFEVVQMGSGNVHRVLGFWESHRKGAIVVLHCTHFTRVFLALKIRGLPTDVPDVSAGALLPALGSEMVWEHWKATGVSVLRNHTEFLRYLYKILASSE
eukprot:2504835-Rhodomonas_salina.1